MSPVAYLGSNILEASSLGTASFNLFGVITYTNIVMDQQGKNLLSKRSDSALRNLLSENIAKDNRTLKICGASFTELVDY